MANATGSAMIWKRVALTLVFVFVLQLLFALSQRSAQSASLATSSQSHGQDAPVLPSDTSLASLDQCRKGFPDLYHEIDRAKDYWQIQGHRITENDVQISWRNSGAFRILIHDNQLRILETRNTFTDLGYRPRTLAVLSQIQQALWTSSALGERIPTLEAAVIVDDISNLPRTTTHTAWTLTSNITDETHDRHWLIPNFNFHSSTDPSTSYVDLRRRTAQQDTSIADKIPRAVWRGGTWSNEPLRTALVNTTQDQPWADVAVVDIRRPEAFLSIDDICKYAMVIHTEGRTYSGRLDYLLNCDSVPIIHDLAWKTHYTHLLVSAGPRQNYVPVQRDFGDLETKVASLIQHPKHAQRIADEARHVFRDRYLSPTAVTCYWRKLMHGYAATAFTPRVTDADGNMRGIPFEEFIHLRADYEPLIQT